MEKNSNNNNNNNNKYLKGNEISTQRSLVVIDVDDMISQKGILGNDWMTH